MFKFHGFSLYGNYSILFFKCLLCFLSKNFKRRLLFFFSSFSSYTETLFAPSTQPAASGRKTHTHKTTTNILLTTWVSLRSIGICLNRYRVVVYNKSRFVIYCKCSVVLENWNNCWKFFSANRNVVKIEEFYFKLWKKWRF